MSETIFEPASRHSGRASSLITRLLHVGDPRAGIKIRLLRPVFPGEFTLTRGTGRLRETLVEKGVDIVLAEARGPECGSIEKACFLL